MKKGKIITIFLICICLLIVLVLALTKVKQPKVSKDGTTKKDQLLLSGFAVFSEKYTGDYTASEAIDIFNELIKEDLPGLYKDIKKMNDTKLENYYNENFLTIEKKFGIGSLDEFLTFVKGLKSENKKLDKWYKVIIDTNSFVDNSDKPQYCYFEYELRLENEKSLNFSAYLAHKETKKPRLIISLKK